MKRVYHRSHACCQVFKCCFHRTEQTPPCTRFPQPLFSVTSRPVALSHCEMRVKPSVTASESCKSQYTVIQMVLLSSPRVVPFNNSSPPRWLSSQGICLENGRPWFDSRFLRGDFSGSSDTSDLKIGAPVATLPGAWC